MSKHLEELEELSRLRLGIILLIKELEKNKQLEPIYMYLKDLIEGVDDYYDKLGEKNEKK